MNAHTAPVEDDESTGFGWWFSRIVSMVVLLFVVAVLLAAVIVPKVAGAMPYTVLTSSMEPTYPPGTLIITKPIDDAELAIGQAVTYQIESGKPDVITHRIIASSIEADGTTVYTTQGDNNPVADEKPVQPVQIRGAVWYSIPYLGYVNNWLTGDRRTVVVGGIAGALVLYALYQFVGAGIDRSRRRS
ncbi:signal peptidase I [Rhodococcoides kyotonense]|uniref:Signal peptidase I n=1 Tax=Rhodococcoides kyotonense TaxID=398843 RepID=A0A239J7J1_9NOCA|nr:signal peptidase I [Rhodococcus kyotonensis]SNT01632.1 signal peptidase, endoplasmic reticulum-type [Rhodococcus kyotonensis]